MTGIFSGTERKGVNEYKLYIEQPDRGQSLWLVFPDSKQTDVQQYHSMGVENYIGKEIEWRVVREGTNVKPIAIIFENGLLPRGEPGIKPEINISVFKTIKDSACLIADLRTYDFDKAFDD